jgi:hypothetical protein
MGSRYQKENVFSWLIIFLIGANSFSESLVVVTESETTSGKPVSVQAHFLNKHPLKKMAAIPIPGNRLKKIEPIQHPSEEIRLVTAFQQEVVGSKSTTWNYPVTLKLQPFHLDSGYPYRNAGTTISENLVPANMLPDLQSISSQFKMSGLDSESPSMYVVNGIQELDDETRQVSFVTLISESVNKPITKSFKLKGTITVEIDRIVNIDKNTWWLLSRDEGNGFGYLYRLQKKNDDWSIQEKLTMSGIRFTLVLAKNNLPDQLYLGADHRLSLYTSDKYIPGVFEFKSPIRTMLREGNSIYIGESGNIHEFDLKSNSILDTHEINTGMIASILPNGSEAAIIPAVSRQPDYLSIDVNETGLLFTKQANQVYEWDWAFDTGDETYFELIRERKSNQHEWLKISQKDVFQSYTQNPVVLGLHYTNSSPNSDREFYTHHLPLFPKVNPVVRNPIIQWLVQDPVFENALPFISQTSQPPYGVRHIRLSTSDEMTKKSDLLIVDILSVLKGDITRETILGRLRQKGRIVILLNPLESQFVPFVTQWLSPWNITSAFETEKLSSENWPFSNREGIPFFSPAGTGQHTFHKNRADQWGYAEIPFENGILAVVCSPDVFFDPNKNHSQADRAVLMKLLNLIQSVGKFSDKDQDGILDVIENKSEPKGLIPLAFMFDRDQDGLPDGAEDQNHNGKLDHGETHPGRRDTDDDGVWDGADTMPMATLDAPVLHSVTPQNGPAEGGYLLTITGNNFTPRSKIWIDTQQATLIDRKLPSVLLVAAPPIYLPRKNVAIRLIDDSTQTVATMEDGFSYNARSEFPFVFDHFRQITQQYRQYSGSFEISVPSLNRQLDGLFLSFNVASNSGIVDMAFVPDARNKKDGTWKTTDLGGEFDIPNSDRNKVHAKPVGVLRWTADLREAKGDEFQIQLSPARGHVLNGGYLPFKRKVITLNMNPNLKMLTGRVIE